MSRGRALLLIALAVAALPGNAEAQVRDFGEIADGLTGQASPIVRLITAFAFIAGVAMGVRGLTLIGRVGVNNHDPGSKVLMQGFIFLFCGAAMVALPSLLGSSIQTIFGGTPPLADAIGGGSLIPR